MAGGHSSGAPAPSTPRTVTFDPPIHSYLGLEYLALTPSACVARFTVGDSSKQISGQLHGGVSALVAESLASVGAALASGGQLVLGLDVTCSHLRGAPVGTDVLVVARPLRAGRLVQVWEVKLFKIKGHEQEAMAPSASTPTHTLPGGVPAHASLDEATARLVHAAESEAENLVAVARVSCLVRKTAASDTIQPRGSQEAALLARPRSKL